MITWVLGLLLVAALGVIVWLWNRPPKIVEKIIYVEKDFESELKNRLEKEYASKAAKQEQELAAIREQKLQDIVNKFTDIEAQRKEEEDAFQKDLEARRKAAIESIESQNNLREQLNKQKKLEADAKVQEYIALADSQIDSIKAAISEWKSKQDAVIDSYKRLDEINNAESFHKLSFDSQELEEIAELRVAIRKLRNPMPFYKAVYDIYFKNKINDLTLRVVGPNRVSGIYKITHFPSGKVYVGQSVDISNRWKQHVKRGCGADIITSNKLYPAMLEHGVEQFMFEIIEIIEDTSKLNESEKYWQEYFRAQEFGYSMR